MSSVTRELKAGKRGPALSWTRAFATDGSHRVGQPGTHAFHQVSPSFDSKNRGLVMVSLPFRVTLDRAKVHTTHLPLNPSWDMPLHQSTHTNTQSLPAFPFFYS